MNLSAGAAKRPNRPSAKQFRLARERVGGGHKDWSIKMIHDASVALKLPVDVNAITMIERGDEPLPEPTKYTSNVNYRGDWEPYADMTYRQRLHLVYLALGCIFLPKSEVTWADPVDLWGALHQLDRAWKNHIQSGETDLARDFIDRAFSHASNVAAL